MNAPQPDYRDRALARRDLASAGLMPGGAETVDRIEDGTAEAEFLNAGGWRVVSIKGGDEEGGITSHRGVLHPHEYVDEDELHALVEHELGFSYEQIRSVYKQGPKSATTRELRARIDARLLALSRSGANMAELGRVLGFQSTDDTMARPLKNALARARKEQS